MKVHEAFASALHGHGIDTVFGLMGDANMLYLTSYMQDGGRFVPVVHEGNSVGMADAWSRATQRVGVASVTHGPALTNTMTHLVEAVRARSSLLLITGQTPLDPTYFQRIDIAAVAAAAGAGIERVMEPGTVVRDLDRALQRAVSERRPVVLDLPIHLVREEAGEQPAVHIATLPGPMAPADDQLDAALGLVASARRPVILAGRGAVHSGARDELVGLATQLAAPLATTALAKELFATEPGSIGIFGSLSHSVAAEAIAAADCVVAFGASLNSYTTFGHELTRGKKVVQVDQDGAAFDWYTPVDEAVCGDARLTAAAMRKALEGIDHRPNSGWLEGIRRAMESHNPADHFQDHASSETVDIRTAMIRLNELLPAQRVLASDIGRFVVGTWPYVKVRAGGDFISMGAFGSIGLGMSGAIGLSLARPDSLTVGVFGDGGLMMNFAELTTAVRERLPLLVVVLNDGAYGAEYYKLEGFGVDPAYSRTQWPDLVDLARSAGADGMTVRTLADLDRLPDAISDLDRPYLVDVRLDPSVNLLD